MYVDPRTLCFVGVYTKKGEMYVPEDDLCIFLEMDYNLQPDDTRWNASIDRIYFSTIIIRMHKFQFIPIHK